jgi:hypothetical protein
MLLTNEDKQNIMNRFPGIELSYDNILHKKVFADLHILIPSGKKYILWFTYVKSKNVCLLLELNKNNNITNLHYQTYCFDSELSYNTILYGTCINVNDNRFFTCEDILYYKNKNIQDLSFNKKLSIMSDMFQYNIKNTNMSSKNFVITMPIIKTNYEDIIRSSQCVSYSVYGIKFVDSRKSDPIGTMKIIKDTNEVIFKVKADLKQDIYNLFCLDKGVEETLYNIAMIPDYKTSIFMNSLFRTIKENKNLDLLEESDDDEEFEDIREDKFVDLNKTLLMRCVYIPRFRKWKPVSVVNDKDNTVRIISKRELYDLQYHAQKNNNY